MCARCVLEASARDSRVVHAELVTPTDLSLAEHVSNTVGCEVWIKHDDATHPRYGGNKVRKLEYLLEDARAEGATELVTVGAAGSHHVLATTVHGTAAGFRVEAVLSPQKRTRHVEQNLRAGLAQGATFFPVGNNLEVALKVASRAAALRAQGRQAYVIPPGGSTPTACRGYIDAVGELVRQMAEMSLEPFDEMVCALGSGGTLAGLMAGVKLHDLWTGVWGVRVAMGPMMGSAPAVAWLATQAMHLADADRAKSLGRFGRIDVKMVTNQAGDGYGIETANARAAMELFARDGVTLDETYTAKAAAGLIAMARHGPRHKRYLFWNTLSSAPTDGLMTDPSAPLPEAINALLT